MNISEYHQLYDENNNRHTCYRNNKMCVKLIAKMNDKTCILCAYVFHHNFPTLHSVTLELTLELVVFASFWSFIFMTKHFFLEIWLAPSIEKTPECNYNFPEEKIKTNYEFVLEIYFHLQHYLHGTQSNNNNKNIIFTLSIQTIWIICLGRKSFYQCKLYKRKVLGRIWFF